MAWYWLAKADISKLATVSVSRTIRLFYGFNGVNVGTDSRIAAAAVIVSHEYHFLSRDRKVREISCQGKSISIGQDCWIGAVNRVLDCIIIGNGTIVGTGAVAKNEVALDAIVNDSPENFLMPRFTLE